MPNTRPESGYCCQHIDTSGFFDWLADRYQAAMPGSISFRPRAHCVDELTNRVYDNLGLLDRYRVSAPFGAVERALYQDIEVLHEAADVGPRGSRLAPKEPLWSPK